MPVEADGLLRELREVALANRKAILATLQEVREIATQSRTETRRSGERIDALTRKVDALSDAVHEIGDQIRTDIVTAARLAEDERRESRRVWRGVLERALVPALAAGAAILASNVQELRGCADALEEVAVDAAAPASEAIGPVEPVVIEPPRAGGPGVTPGRSHQ